MHKISATILSLLFISGCAITGSATTDLPTGETLRADSASIVHPLSPSIAAYSIHKCLDEDCTEVERGVATQSGWFDPSSVAAAALIGYGLKESGTDITNEGSSANATGTGGSASAGSYSNSKSSAYSNSKAVNKGSGGGCFPPGLCER